MTKRKQLTVKLENKPGALASAAEALASAKVNIKGFSAWAEDGEGYVRFIVDKLPIARKALSQKGLSFEETEVLRVPMRDKPGGLARAARKLATAGKNIRYGYSGRGADGNPRVYLGVD